MEQIGLDFSVVPSEVEEQEAPAEEGPVRYALRQATEKAQAVARRVSAGLVLGADTVVVLDDEVLGKPQDCREARQMLGRLNGREHRVITAFALVLREKSLLIRRWVETRVKMRRLTVHEIEAYVASGEPFDKAGGYGIQGKGVLLVESIQGCYTNVVGLPLPALAEALQEIENQLEAES